MNAQWKWLWTKEASLLDIEQVTHAFVNQVSKLSFFHLVIKGDLGAGKTSFVRACLRQLGLSSSTPVQSPTYTLENEYHIGKHVYLHRDLYRGLTEEQWESGIIATNSNLKGIFSEWFPETFSDNLFLPSELPTHKLEIQKIDDLSKRLYHLFML